MYFFLIFANTVLIANLITTNMKQIVKWTIAGIAMLFAGVTVHAQHTFANPLDVVVGNEPAIRGGEPVVIIFEDNYFLFVSHRRGYWYS